MSLSDLTGGFSLLNGIAQLTSDDGSVVFDPSDGTGSVVDLSVVGGGGGVSSVNSLTGAITLAAGSNVTITPSGNTLTIAASGGGSSAFNDITSGTNTGAAMVVGTGASLAATGSGTIAATAVIVADAGGDTTTFPMLATAATGSLAPATDAGLSYNATTNALTTTTFIGALTGNSSTTTALATGRTINGVTFDGTSNITVTAAAGTLTGTTLASNVVTSSLTSVGTLGDLTVTNPIVGSITGNAATVTVADAGGDTTTFPMLATQATGSLAPATDAGLSYNATTNALTTTTFIGALTGNADSSTTTTTATNVTVANEATDTTCFPLFATAATGNLPPKSNAALTYNSNTASLASTTFVGALTGNVTGNVSGTAATVTTAAQPAITSLGTLTTLTVDDITINGNTISSAGASTLAITPTAGQAITFDGTVTLDAGVIAGATSITSTTFVGALTGNATTATTSTNVTVANEATDTTCFPLFTTAATGDLPPKSNAAFTLNSNTGALGATSFVGAGTGLTGTAASLTAGAVAVGGITGLGTGVATWLATPSSSNLAAAVTGETGTGALVFGTAPTLASTVTIGTAAGATGAALFNGTTSGTVTLSVADAAGTWTMKLPTTAGTSGYMLQTNGSGVTTWAPVTATPGGSDTQIQFNDGGNLGGDAGLTYNKTTDTVTTVNVALDHIVLDGTPNTDHTCNGPTTNTFNAGATITVMDLVYMGGSSKWLLTDADAASTASGMLAISLESKTDTQAMNVALAGSFVRDDTWNWTPGTPLYVDTATPGAITETQPSGTDDVIRVVGWAVTADVIYFSPSPDYITHT